MVPLANREERAVWNITECGWTLTRFKLHYILLAFFLPFCMKDDEVGHSAFTKDQIRGFERFARVGFLWKQTKTLWAVNAYQSNSVAGVQFFFSTFSLRRQPSRPYTITGWRWSVFFFFLPHHLQHFRSLWGSFQLRWTEVTRNSNGRTESETEREGKSKNREHGAPSKNEKKSAV